MASGGCGFTRSHNGNSLTVRPGRDARGKKAGSSAGCAATEKGVFFRVGDGRLICALRAQPGEPEARGYTPGFRPERGRFRRPDFSVCGRASGLFRFATKIIFTESLILAQNERWRRV